MEVFLLLLLIPIIAIVLSQDKINKANKRRKQEIAHEKEADLIIQRLQGIVKRKQPSFTKK